MDTQDALSRQHLSDAELFGLAAPAAGDPEALPEHLSRCQACSRALAEWKDAVRVLAEEDVDAIGRRSPEEWRAAEESTMAAIRRAGRGRRVAHPVRWALGIAASLLLVALAVPARRALTTAPRTGSAAAASEEAELSASDRADDALLRDAEFLARAGDTAGDFVPESRL
jgi:hypothetical protein